MSREGGEGPGKEGADGHFRPPRHLGDLRAGKADEARLKDDLPVLVREFFEGGLDATDLLCCPGAAAGRRELPVAGKEVEVGRASGGGCRVLLPVRVPLRRLPVLPAVSDLPQRRRVQPMAEGGLATMPEPSDVREHFAADGLREVGDRFVCPESRSGPEPHERPEPGKVPPDQLLQRVLVAVCGAVHQFPGFVGHAGRPLPRPALPSVAWWGPVP
jgi:hypothetical protein